MGANTSRSSPPDDGPLPPDHDKAIAWLRHLPSPKLPAFQRMDPLHFSTEELDVLKGTNLYGANIDDDVGLGKRSGNSVCLADVSTVNAVWGKGLTWEPYPRRAHCGGWGCRDFNNYGAKPNSELLLGYGFTLPDNPDDTIVKIGGGAGDDTTRHEVGRGARGADRVWGAIVGALKAQEDGDAPEWQTVLDAADMLRSMTEALLARLPNVPVSGALRTDIADMIGHYVSGQHEVLQDLVEYANMRETDGVAMARREGVVVQLEGVMYSPVRGSGGSRGMMEYHWLGD
ncbi:hypothetical protein EDB84DRAFT_1436376 [Lactarius hengduanensis]|nr:hypothetical protein EDB84DRAFT_1436376 [Lactarius hengduanensis]